MTSIFSPTKAVEKLASIDGWQLIVVGDKKSPKDWFFENVIYLSPRDQLGIKNDLIKLLPWNHYSRKLIGYLYAINQGAEIIADVDDDNLPTDNYGDIPVIEEYYVANEPEFVNIYQYFSDDFIWPRGFPLIFVKRKSTNLIKKSNLEVGIWQFLANGDPDVDAIYRLLFNQNVNFKIHDPIVLDKGTFCPFNSQNTFFYKKTFPLLYLPSTVSFRFTDILRGIVAQPILWEEDLHLGFGNATMIQERNIHDYMNDFESEIPMYLNTLKVAQIAKESVKKDFSISENLISVYENLFENDIVQSNELDILKAWLQLF
jgi:hypothetical protein